MTVNKPSFQPRVCKNNCYLLTAGSSFVSSLSMSFSLSLSLALTLSLQLLLLLSSEVDFGIGIHWRHPGVWCKSELTATQTQTRT